MLRKALFSVSLALVSLLILAMGVMAQGVAPSDDDDAPAITVQPDLAAASVVQTIPVTLTLLIPGPTGPITVEVPVFLSLDIRIGISPELTTTVAVTPGVVVTDAEGELVVSPVGADEDDVTVEATDDSVAAAPTATATPTPAPPAPTPTPATIEPTPEPTAPALPTPTPVPTVAEPVIEAPLCPDLRAVIVAPGEGQVLSGDVNMLGTATHENFQYYKIEYAAGANVDPNEAFVYLADARVPVTGGILASFDSTILENGDYTLKLTVVDSIGNFPPPCTVSVVIAN